MKSRNLQPLALIMCVLAGLLLIRVFLPEPKRNVGLTVQSGSYPAGVAGSSSGFPEFFKGQY